MKKSTFFLLVFICINNVLVSQHLPDKMVDSVGYLTPAEAAFMVDKEAKYLLKIYSQRNTPGAIIRNQLLALSFERKLSKAFSLSFLSSIPIEYEYLKAGERHYTFSEYYWYAGLNLRYYYELPKWVKARKQANNLSGNYIAFTFERNLIGAPLAIAYSTKPKPPHLYYLTYGIQKRFLNRGFVDFTINLGRLRDFQYNRINGQISSHNLSNYNLSFGVKAGIAFGKKYLLEENLICPIFKCHTDRNTAFKINLIQNWSMGWQENLLYGDPGIWYMIVNPNISYELKLAKSPLSFNQDLDLEVLFRNHRFNDANGFGLASYTLTYQAGFRYYYNMRNRVRKGKSGNNLSGYYAFIRGQYEQSTDFGWFGAIDDVWELGIRKRFAAQLGGGYQREVLKRMYFDVNFGVSQNIEPLRSSWLSALSLISTVKVGLLF